MKSTIFVTFDRLLRVFVPLLQVVSFRSNALSLFVQEVVVTDHGDMYIHIQ